MTRFISQREAARVLGITRQSVAELVGAGRLAEHRDPGAKRGTRSLFYDCAEVVALADARRHQPSQPDDGQGDEAAEVHPVVAWLEKSRRAERERDERRAREASERERQRNEERERAARKERAECESLLFDIEADRDELLVEIARLRGRRREAALRELGELDEALAELAAGIGR